MLARKRRGKPVAGLAVAARTPDAAGAKPGYLVLVTTHGG